MTWSWYRRVPPWIVDGVLVCLLLAVMVGTAVHERGPASVRVALALAETLPLLVRRRWPLPVLAVSLAAWLAWFGYSQQTNPVPLLLALYTVAAHESRRRAAAAGVAAAAAAVLPVAF